MRAARRPRVTAQARRSPRPSSRRGARARARRAAPRARRRRRSLPTTRFASVGGRGVQRTGAGHARGGRGRAGRGPGRSPAARCRRRGRRHGHRAPRTPPGCPGASSAGWSRGGPTGSRRCGPAAATRPATRSGRPRTTARQPDRPGRHRGPRRLQAGYGELGGQPGQVGEPGREAAERATYSTSQCARATTPSTSVPHARRRSSRSAPSYVTGTSTSAPAGRSPVGAQSRSASASAPGRRRRRTARSRAGHHLGGRAPAPARPGRQLEGAARRRSTSERATTRRSRTGRSVHALEAAVAAAAADRRSEQGEGPRWYEHQEPLGSTGNGDAQLDRTGSPTPPPRHRADAASCLVVWIFVPVRSPTPPVPVSGRESSTDPGHTAQGRQDIRQIRSQGVHRSGRPVHRHEIRRPQDRSDLWSGPRPDRSSANVEPAPPAPSVRRPRARPRRGCRRAGRPSRPSRPAPAPGRRSRPRPRPAPRLGARHQPAVGGVAAVREPLAEHRAPGAARPGRAARPASRAPAAARPVEHRPRLLLVVERPGGRARRAA